MPEFRSTLSDDDRRALDAFTARCGRFGERERRVVPLQVAEVRDSGDPESAFIVKGHGSVFNRKSLDLGGFQERIDPGAFTDVLDTNPDVHLLWDHDTRFALARTMSKRYLLELREDPKGLFYYARVAPTSFAADLRVLMEGGVIDQASFAFSNVEDTWEESGGIVTRTIHRIGALYDVTITAAGAYPQADSAVVRAYAQHHAATKLGRLTTDDTDKPPVAPSESEERGAISEDVAPADPVGAEETPSHQEVDGDPSHAQGVGGDIEPRDWNRSEEAPPLLRAARFGARQATEFHRHLLKETQS
jgi:HK97 family phage prohead protease